MLTFVLLGVITVVSFVVSYLVDRFADSYIYDWVAYTFLSIGIFTIIGLIITACTLININTRFEATQNKYESIVRMVETYEGQDYGNMVPLVEDIVDMNHTISQHRAHYKSKWTGPWFSEDIAKLELIDFSRKVASEE